MIIYFNNLTKIRSTALNHFQEFITLIITKLKLIVGYNYFPLFGNNAKILIFICYQKMKIKIMVIKKHIKKRQNLSK